MNDCDDGVGSCVVDDCVEYCVEDCVDDCVGESASRLGVLAERFELVDVLRLIEGDDDEDKDGVEEGRVVVGPVEFEEADEERIFPLPFVFDLLAGSPSLVSSDSDEVDRVCVGFSVGGSTTVCAS